MSENTTEHDKMEVGNQLQPSNS